MPELNLKRSRMLPIIELRYKSQCARHEMLPTVCSVIAGTYVERKMEQFLQSPKTKKTVINGLVLFEQRVNLLNVPLILMQLLWIMASDYLLSNNP